MIHSPLSVFALCVVVATGFVDADLAAQTAWQVTTPPPFSEFREYAYASGDQRNNANAARVVHQHTVQFDGAGFLRIHFGEVHLGPGSVIRVTSLLDGEVQVLTPSGLREWQDTTAYFNGSAVLVEIIAGPNTTRNRFSIHQIEKDLPHPIAGCGYPCGICDSDDRVASIEQWSGRLLTGLGWCSASV